MCVMMIVLIAVRKTMCIRVIVAVVTFTVFKAPTLLTGERGRAPLSIVVGGSSSGRILAVVIYRSS